MKNILAYTMCLAGALALNSCADSFLEQENTHQFTPDNFFDSDAAVMQATSPLYSYVWYDFNDKFYYGMGDGRANNITAQYSNYIYPYTNFTDNSLSQGLSEAWGALYSVVSQANNAINNIETKCKAGVSESAKTQAIAEARFMRGLAYWYIGSLWGCGIIYTNTSDMVNNYVVPAQPRADVIEFAIRDMEYAAMHLPAAQSDKGRVNKYSAYGMLTRFYLTMAGLTTDGIYDGTNVATDFNRGTRNQYYLTLAVKAAETVIQSKAFSLVSDYSTLFAAATQNNNSESMFQLQFLQGDGVGGAAQSMTRFFAWSTMVADTNAWGAATYCSYDLWAEFKEYLDATLGETIDDAVRRHYSVASYGESYPELSADPADPYVYGVTESASSQGANIKKYVIGTKKVNGFSVPNNSGINTYMLRLAEVYLNYAEAALGNKASLSKEENSEVFDCFNELRRRAKVPEKSKITYEDIRHENRMEFAFEGLYWYQLIRRGYYQQQEVVNYCNNQHRNASYYTASTHEYKLPDNYSKPATVATATAKHLTLPMADTDQTKNPNLKTDANGNVNTVAYTFGEREVSHDALFSAIK